MPANASQALQNLEDALAGAEARAAEAQREADGLRAARDAMIAAMGGERPLPSAGTGRRRQTVAKHHVDAVREYLQKHGSARQADIGKELSINSGIVSVALQRLQEAGEITYGGKDYGSRVWNYGTEAVSAA